MADVLIDKYRVKVVRQGTTPANPGNVTTDPLSPVNPGGGGGTFFGVGAGLSLDSANKVQLGDGTFVQYLYQNDNRSFYLPFEGVSVNAYLENTINETDPFNRFSYSSLTADWIPTSTNAVVQAFAQEGFVASQMILDGSQISIQKNTLGDFRMIVTDVNNLKGLEYAADYSAVGTLDNRWIPDWGAVQGAIAGVPTTFLGLTDTPSAYTGQAGKVVAVNSGENGLEFITVSGGGNYIAYDVAQSLTGTQKSQALDNIGSSAGSIESFSNTGTVTLNDLVITKSNIEFTGASTVTLNGIVPLWTGQEVTIWNRTGNNITIAREAAGSTGANRFWETLIIPSGSGGRIKYTNVNGSLRWSIVSTPFFLGSSGAGIYTLNQVGMGTTPNGNIGLLVKPRASGTGVVGFRIVDFSDNSLFDSIGTNLNCYTQMDFTRTTAGFYNLTVRATNASYWSVAFRNTSGTDQASVNNTGGFNGLGNSSFGVSALNSTANTKLAVRGNGTTTGVTLLLEDSAGTDMFQFLDNGNIVLNSTNGNKFGTATTQKLAFWNATPIVQPTTGIAAAAFVANTSGIANDTATFGGYTIGQVVQALRNVGLLA